ncbi:MAG: hypothetical protein DBY27_02605 [Clostridiaceae bacterium]|nr:MAG: hypothetical protein DBY27_02605 [Clostridiaceae bacterium]
MKQERMKDAMKDTFSKLELSENAKEEVWEQIAEKIGHSNGKKSGRIQKVLIKTAAVVLVVVLLFAGINKLSAGKLAEAVTGFWRADKNSSKVLQETTDYHVMLDSVYAPELWECTQKRIVFAGTFGVVIYDRTKEQVTGTINLSKTDNNYFNADTLQTKYLLEKDSLWVYHCKNGKPAGRCYQYDLSACGSAKNRQIVSLKPVTSQKAQSDLETKRKEQQKGKYTDTWNRFENRVAVFDKKYFSEKAIKQQLQDGKTADTCLVLEWNAKDDSYRIYLYMQDRKEKALKKEKLSIQASVTEKKQIKYPKYSVASKKKLENAVIDCFYNDPVLYEGCMYQAYKYASSVETGKGDFAIPVYKIISVKKHKKQVKLLGEFTWYCFAVSDQTVYVSNSGGGVGVMYMTKEEQRYRVTKMVHPRDGAYFIEDLLRLFDQDKKAVDRLLAMNSRDVLQKELKEYVRKNDLAIHSYKAFGWDPVKLR